MSQQPQNPKSRGRARGRARQTAEETRRPGTEAERGGAAAAPAAVHPTQGNGGGGRRAHRGAPRVDPVPSGQRTSPVEAATASMGAMSLAEQVGRYSGGLAEPVGRSRGRANVPSCDNTRPQHITDKRGTTGESITLVANYFQLLSRPQWCVYQYHVDFAPVVESSRMRRGFMREHKETLGACYIFDGMSDLKMMQKVGETLELYSKRNTDGETIRITITLKNELAPNHPELQRLFNTQMRRNLQHLKFQLLGRHYFDPTGVNEVPEYNLQIWQGVTTSIRQHEEKVLMCVDTVHKVVRRETALEIIMGKAREGGPNYRDDVARELVGSVVMTRYNNRTYRIEDIDWMLNPNSTFDAKDGPITYVKYYKQQYDINIRDLKQPLLLCTSKEREIRAGASTSKKIYLIPELCCMTGITDSMRANFSTMKELGNRTRVDPAKRVDNLNKFIQRVNSNKDIITEMEAWGIKFANNLVQFQARLVPPELIVIGGGRKKDFNRGNDFTACIRSDPMFVAKNLQEWIVICTRFDRDKVNEMLSTLSSVARKLGMNIQRPRLCEIQNDRINNYFNAFKENYNQNTQLVTFIVPNNKKERYDALKKYCCVDNAVPSQVIVSRTISRPKALMTVATKVAIQMNCKLGGEPWTIEIPLKARLMICGYDTYHDSSRKGRSAGAFVASLNQTLTRWFSKVSFHSAGGWEELSNHLRANFTEALKKYMSVNNCLPDIILLYRDGVGDGQIGYVKEWEVRQFVSVIQECMKDKQIRYGFIVVNKKVNSRFFLKQGNSFCNPPHGSIIDNTVTRYDRYDFFLVSQVALQGTVSPTMYNVIEDASGMRPEHIQRLTYKLTHLYFNYSGTISVPAPCQYAHKLAFLAGQSLHQPPRDELCDSLFYL